MNKHVATRTAAKSNGHLKNHAHSYKNFTFDREYRKIKSAIQSAQRGAQRKAKTFVNNSIKNIKSTSQNAEERMTDFIKEKPIQTLSCVALVGFVLGWLMRK